MLWYRECTKVLHKRVGDARIVLVARLIGRYYLIVPGGNIRVNHPWSDVSIGVQFLNKWRCDDCSGQVDA